MSDKFEYDASYMAPQPPKFKWNWGAFVMPVPFGIGNCAYLCLLTLVPFLNFVWMFISGAMGEQWAYESKNFKNAETFTATMKSWNRAGFVMFIASIVILALYLLFFGAMLATIFSALGKS